MLNEGKSNMTSKRPEGPRANSQLTGGDDGTTHYLRFRKRRRMQGKLNTLESEVVTFK